VFLVREAGGVVVGLVETGHTADSSATIATRAVPRQKVIMILRESLLDAYP
jgi:hypothetical protein